MLLKSVEIQGFKSFADKTVLRFGSGITAVVGPNGSGKSNITDAVRWVLGEQSTKNLRGQNMEDVIFGGTADRKPYGFAEVTITVDNTDRALRCNSDTVAVTRRFYRSRESEYLINRAVVRLRDVRELFMDTGLGRDGYSMVSQGKIDSIVGSKPEERRDIFEEASGISRYRYRKEDAEKRLQAADENILRLRDILAELEQRVGPLKAQSEKAKRFLELEETRKNLEIGLWLNKLDRFAESLRNEENRITIAEAHYRETEKNLALLSEQIENRSRRFSELTEEIDGISRQISQTEAEITRAEGEITLRENTIVHNNETAERVRGDIESLRLSGTDALREIETITAEKKEKAETLASQNTVLTELNTELERLSCGDEDFSKSAGELGAKLAALASGESDIKVALVTAETAASEVASRVGAIETELKNAGDTVNEYKKERERINGELKIAEEKTRECENALNGCKMLEETRSVKLGECRRALDSANLDIEENRRRVKIVSDLQRNMEGYSHAVKSVVKAADGGSLRGIIGPVSQIVSVPDEYTAAIEVALGSAAQYIVTESEESAKRAIDWLRRGNNGRATFLPVNTVRPRRFNGGSARDCVGYIGSAAELVSFDVKYTNVIESLLGGVAVADSLDSAAAIAKRLEYKCKVVSLDGQVVNPGGSLTGGSLNRQAGLIGRISEIKKLEKRGEVLRANAELYAENLGKAESDLAEARAKLESASTELSKANETVLNLSAEAKRFEQLQAAAELTVQSLENERGELKNRAEALAEEREAAIKSLDETVCKRRELQAELDGITRNREDISARRDELTEKISACRLSVIECEKDLESLEGRFELIERGRADSQSKIDGYLAEISQIDAKNAEITADIELLKQSIANARIKADELSARMNETVSERDGYGRTDGELRNRELEITSEREKLAGEIARLSERKDRLIHENDEIVRRLFDEYELTVSEAENTAERPENPSEAEKRLGEIKNGIRRLGVVNVSAIEEYKEVNERYFFLKEQVDDVEKSRRELKDVISELTGQMKSRFTKGFADVAANFSQTFTELFGGGKAALILTEPDSPLTSGVDIEVKLPGKNVPSLNGLSGGEKALVAIAVYFAIMKTNPPPFCFLDEVDTALDDINVERFAGYMRSSKLPTQFICVTHRRGTMEAADMLYGVTMQEKGVSKLLQLDVDELIKTLHLEDK